MKRLLLLLPVLFCAGCASPYWQDRRADAADVFTATVGIGIGATARIGPLHAGLGANTDFYGVEGGESVQGGLGLLVVGAGYEASDAAFGPFGRSVVHLGTDARRRGKNNVPPSGERGLRPIPFWDPPEPVGGNPARWTQIEVAAGLLGGVRLGFNPGELLDLLLGVFGVDLYDDDIAGLPSDEKTPAERRWEASYALAQERADRARRRRLDRALDRCGFAATRVLALEDRSALPSWRPDFAAAGWEERPCTLAGGGFKWYKASPAADGGRHHCEIGVFVAESAEAAHDAMAAKMEPIFDFAADEIRVSTGGQEPGDVCAKYGSDGSPCFRLWFRRGNVLVEVRNDEALVRALDAQILVALQPHAESAEIESHAESAGNAEPISHAESAEEKSYAESAEPIIVPNRLRLSGTDIPLEETNHLAFAVEKGRLPCEFALDCRRLETGCLTVFCENGQAVFYPSNRIDVVTEGGIETIAAEHPVATLSFGEGVNHERALVVDPEGLRRQREPNARTALRCKVAEDEKRYLVTIPIVLSHDCPPTNVTFQLLSNWYDY